MKWLDWLLSGWLLERMLEGLKLELMLPLLAGRDTVRGAGRAGLSA